MAEIQSAQSIQLHNMFAQINDVVPKLPMTKAYWMMKASVGYIPVFMYVEILLKEYLQCRNWDTNYFWKFLSNKNKALSLIF